MTEQRELNCNTKTEHKTNRVIRFHNFQIKHVSVAFLLLVLVVPCTSIRFFFQIQNEFSSSFFLDAILKPCMHMINYFIILMFSLYFCVAFIRWLTIDHHTNLFSVLNAFRLKHTNYLNAC